MTPTVDVIASGIHDAKNSMFNALARIRVAVQAIDDGKGGVALPALTEAETAVVAAADRLSKLLSAYRLAGAENLVSLLPVYVGDLIEDVLIRARESAGGGIKIVADCRYDGVWICDREVIADCLVNALQNALRHSRREVHLNVAEIDGQLAIAVADDGPGFSVQPPSRAGSEHSGVGLFIAQRIAHLHQRHGRRGELRLSNGGPLGGACFELRLP
ncbi:MAG: HAMP domain-containing sensor histidine kinase [Azonexus sp.]